MPTSEHLARLELVRCPAIRALALAMVGHIDIDLGVAVPQLHVGLGAGAVNAALRIQVLGSQFNDGSSAHSGCLSLGWRLPLWVRAA